MFTKHELLSLGNASAGFAFSSVSDFKKQFNDTPLKQQLGIESVISFPPNNGSIML